MVHYHKNGKEIAKRAYNGSAIEAYPATLDTRPIPSSDPSVVYAGVEI